MHSITSMRNLPPAMAMAAALLSAGTALAETAPLDGRIDAAVNAVEPKVVAWRRDIHQNPELGFQEVRTAKLVADHLTALGYEVKTGVGRTGVVALLRGGKPGPVVALRADMDALPVKEEVDVPFASKVMATWRGQQVSVMHACGHDAHVAILMGVAEVLASLKADLPGTIKLLFQPAEEGSPDGTAGGATSMVRDGAMQNPKPEAIFGLHVTSAMRVGDIALKPAGLMASSDSLRIEIKGSQTHGAMPWGGVDPIVAAAQVVMALQTIPSRQIDVTRSPVVVTVGSIHGGNRGNIIPETVLMEGTIRSHDEGIRDQLHAKIKEVTEATARAAGTEAKVTINRGYPVTYNDPPLTEWAGASLRRAAGDERVQESRPVMGAEDFSILAREAPGVFFFLGITPADKRPGATGMGGAAPNHSPRFFIDESGLKLGVRALSFLAVDYLGRKK
ncbi:amidohydrolase [Reyranella sp. CPCC 100927]|uniref:amidohydrolase n=1 Tax=Reyranella sp. CPCC 100927 TaxID=2599616 RepID=UPI0011B80683|nr:amidohydrolase [Reyranella sp. CPCC 100927]TWT13040.1 amidohydrolase [Reyranella sp. CPCC 100927]